jgi:hypothetical protein
VLLVLGIVPGICGTVLASLHAGSSGTKHPMRVRYVSKDALVVERPVKKTDEVYVISCDPYSRAAVGAMALMTRGVQATPGFGWTTVTKPGMKQYDDTIIEAGVLKASDNMVGT